MNYSDSQILQNKARHAKAMKFKRSLVLRVLSLLDSSVVYHKSKNSFWAKICMNISFQLLFHIMKVKSQEDQ